MDKLEKTIDVAAPDYAAQVADLFREHNRALIAFLQCKLNSVHDAQEVAQETFMRMLTLDRPEQIGSLRAYLFRIASNLAVDRLRMHKVRSDAAREQLPDEPWHGAPVPERQASVAEQWRDIREALRELPTKTHQAFVMHVIEGRDFTVVAQTMKLSERMVRYHVTHALAYCRARVGDLEML